MNQNVLGKPKFSVCVVTYNHEKTILQCLESLVSQETDFDFEIIVGEDCSTDRTRELVQDFAARYPTKVRLLLHSHNVGATKNYVLTHNMAVGKYVAHVDGDDFALPGKLAALANAFDSNPAVNVVWHRTKILDMKSGTMVDDLIDVALQPEGGFSRTDLLAFGSVGAHSSSAYRAKVDHDVNLSHNEMLDFYIMVERLGDGRGMWIEGFHGVYRRDVGVMSSGRSKLKLLFVRHLRFFMEKHPECRKQINSLALLLLLADLKNMRHPVAFGLWVETFHPLSIIEFLRRLPMHRILRLP